MKAATMVVVVAIMVSSYLIMAVTASILDDPRTVNTACYWSPPSSAMKIVPDGFCATQYATGLGTIYDVIVDEFGRPLVIDSKGLIRMVYDTDASGFSESDEWITIFDGSKLGLTGAMAYVRPYIFASSATTVYRIDYPTLGIPRTVTSYVALITGIPTGGLTGRRALTLDVTKGYLYVSLPAMTNVDTTTAVNNAAAMIKRFSSSPRGSTPSSWQWTTDDGVIVATGVRQAASMAVDSDHVLWSIDTAPIGVTRSDVAPMNPNETISDEFNRHRPTADDMGRSYGYPYCFSEGITNNGLGFGTQWSIYDPASVPVVDSVHDDTWCRNTTNNIVPSTCLFPESSPSGVTFYNPSLTAGWSFPDDFTGSAFIALHGADQPITLAHEASVARVVFDGAGNAYDTIDFLMMLDTNVHRPTDVKVGIDGELWITSDVSGALFVVRYLGVPQGDNITVSHSYDGVVVSLCSSCAVAPAIPVPWYNQRTKMAEGAAIAVIVILVVVLIIICVCKRRKDRNEHEATIRQLSKSTGGRVRDIEMGATAPSRGKAKGGAPRAGLR